MRASKTGRDLVVRARVVLMCADQVPTWKQKLELKTDAQRVSRWRVRWASWQERLCAAEAEDASDKDLKALVLAALSDAPRPGTPAKFSPEQLTAIVAVACEKPPDSELPVSHWTPSEVAREATKRGIVESISPRQVDRFLQRCRAQTA